MKRTTVFIALLLCLGLILAGCTVPTPTPSTSAGAEQSSVQPADSASTAPSASAATSEGKKLKIAAIMKNRSNPYYHSMEQGFIKAAADFNCDVEVFALESDADLDKEMQLADDLLNKDYDGMVLIPINGTAFAPYIKRANDKGLPIVNIDTLLDEAALKEVGATYVTYVGSDDYSAGQLAGEAIAKAVNKTGDVAVLEGSPGSSTADQRKLGFNDYIDKINKEGGSMKIVASQTANWDTNKAFEVFQNILQANPKLVALFASNDLMALGAINAAEAAGRSDIKIVSVDKIPDAIQAVKDGKLFATISQAPDMMAYIGVQKLLDSIAGKTVEKEYRTESVLLYKDNIDQ